MAQKEDHKTNKHRKPFSRLASYFRSHFGRDHQYQGRRSKNHGSLNYLGSESSNSTNTGDNNIYFEVANRAEPQVVGRTCSMEHLLDHRQTPSSVLSTLSSSGKFKDELASKLATGPPGFMFGGPPPHRFSSSGQQQQGPPAAATGSGTAASGDTTPGFPSSTSPSLPGLSTQQNDDPSCDQYMECALQRVKLSKQRRGRGSNSSLASAFNNSTNASTALPSSLNRIVEEPSATTAPTAAATTTNQEHEEGTSVSCSSSPQTSQIHPKPRLSTISRSPTSSSSITDELDEDEGDEGKTRVGKVSRTISPSQSPKPWLATSSPDVSEKNERTGVHDKEKENITESEATATSAMFDHLPKKGVEEQEKVSVKTVVNTTTTSARTSSQGAMPSPRPVSTMPTPFVRLPKTETTTVVADEGESMGSTLKSRTLSDPEAPFPVVRLRPTRFSPNDRAKSMNPVAEGESNRHSRVCDLVKVFQQGGVS